MTNHPNRKRARVSPSHVVADTARAAFLKEGPHRANAVRLAWEIPGPKDTTIAWLSCYLIGNGLCIVETFEDGSWVALTPNGSIDVAESIADVFNRCGVPTAGAPMLGEITAKPRIA